MSKNSCRMLLSHSLRLASTISLTRNVTLLGTSQCAPSAHCIGKTCTKQKRCKEDRKHLWWNGMDRFLLNGRILQP
ncbi:hypothetical protein BDR07DRAFT_1402856 [Suillus spraguei]|nr:hypothetical protein BDR07DRAFT_1402856 [Suillus spraguei]